MSGRLVTVFGGSGFVGRYVVERLAAQGDRVRVAVRRPQQALFLKPLGDVGQVQIVAANVRDEASVTRAVAGADAVINLVGVLNQSGSQSFKALQAEGAGRVAAAAARAGVATFTHVSAIGADTEARAAYAASKGVGEAQVLAAFPSANIVRPSLILGSEDAFVAQFACLTRALPVLPLPCLESKFQPVCVGDVADAIVKLAAPKSGFAGQTFELGGPEVLSFKALVERVMDHIKTHRPIVAMPLGLAKIQAFLTGFLPNPPMTLDSLAMLQHDNVVAEGAKSFADLGLNPAPIDAVMPKYTVQYRPKGQFS